MIEHIRAATVGYITITGTMHYQGRIVAFTIRDCPVTEGGWAAYWIPGTLITASIT